jgi:hypothetical protein
MSVMFVNVSLTFKTSQARNYRRMFAESDVSTSARVRFYENKVQQITDKIATLEQPLMRTPVSRNGIPSTPRTP